MAASDKFRKEHPGKELHGCINVDDINIGDTDYVDGVVESIRETKVFRFITYFDGAAGQYRRETKYRKGQTIYVP